MYSFILWDCSFREKFHTIQSIQNLKISDPYEIIWVEFYEDVSSSLRAIERITPELKIICLKNNKGDRSHSGFCINEGVKAARFNNMFICDGDVVFNNKFLTFISSSPNLSANSITYFRRWDEVLKPSTYSFDPDALEQRELNFNPYNYAGAFFIHKESFMRLGGYDNDPIFSGYTAVAKDFYIRALNAGYSVSWNADKCLFHPWHPGSNPWYIYYFSDQKIILNERINKLTTQPNISMDGIKKKSLDAIPKTFKNKFRMLVLNFLTRINKR